MPTPRTSTRVRRTSPRQGPRAPEHLVERMVVAAIGMVNAYTDRLMRALSPLLEERFGQKQDAASQHPGKGGVAGVFDQLPEGELTKPFLEKMFVLVDRQAADDLQRVVPVPLKDVLPNAAAHQKAWVDRNTSLIRLEERARKEVAGILDGPLREGIRVEEVRKRIQERLNVVRSRAELIARDQTLKLYGQVQEQRQTEAGIVEYTWSTSEDERVRGNPAGLYPKSHGNHWRLEGTTQRWDTPPVVDAKAGRREHPGGDFQCRCAAIPILPTDLSEEPANDVPRGRAPVPANDVPFRPEEQELAAPLPDPVEQERQRLAQERAAREAEQARAIEQLRQREAERERDLDRRLAEARQATEARRAAEAARRAPGSPPVETFAVSKGIPKSIERTWTRQLAEVRPAKTPSLQSVAVRNSSTVVSGRLKAEGFATRGGHIEIAAKPYYPGFREPQNDTRWRVVDSLAVSSRDMAAQTLVHEYGHHVHFQAGNEIDTLILEAFRRECPIAAADAGGKRTTSEGAVSRYGATNHLEFWAEAFHSWYKERAWLRANKPRVYDLVERVLGLLS